MRRSKSGNKRCEYFFPEEENYGKGDESRLRMEIRDESKTVELWLTREERDDLAFRESLKTMYQKYKEQKYLVAVFLSGEEELYQQTRDLLLYNQRRQAEKEVQEQKQGRQAMTM